MTQNREYTSHVHVCESRAHPVLNQSLGGFICNIRIQLLHLPAGIFFIVTVIHDFSKQIKQSTRIGKIFARWHLVIAITTKKIDIIQCITHYTNTLTK